MTAGEDFAADLALALSLADDADRHTMSRFRADDLVVDTKPDLTPVTEADREAEALIRRRLEAERPADAVLGEEHGRSGTGSRTWILDPIDGTKNYVRGVPVWATLIALAVDDEVKVGVVSAPALARRWWAWTGGGAWSSAPGAPRRRVQASRVSRLEDASLSISDTHGWPRAGLDRLLAGTWRQRGYGDFWSHLLVAEGAVDIAAEPQLNIWDIAALIPVVSEAGGRITAFDGSPALHGGSALTTNGPLHEAVLALLR